MDIYSAFKGLAFKFDPEMVHNITLKVAGALPRTSEVFSPLQIDNRFSLTCSDLTWNFPVGLAAGFDKEAQAIHFFQRLGFGATEVGTITKHPQIGNERPRIFRHPELNSIRNAMGFPNSGSEAIYSNILRTGKMSICLGANIGKNKDTSEEKAPEEYAYLYSKFAPVSDYLVVNISSPNTPGLRDFQKKEMLKPIISAVAKARLECPKPVFIKVAPDLTKENLELICDISKEYNFSGIIATNTTIQHNFGKGGLSGAYIKPYAKKVRSWACEFMREDHGQSVIGVGGIDTYQEIKEFWQQGGGFVQVYTGYIYKGPALLAEIKDGIERDFIKYKVNSLEELHKFFKS